MSKLTSNQITFIDLTDTRTFKIYLQANIPTIQAYNKNNGSFSPSWEYQNLTITPDIYLNSSLLPLTTSGLSVTWQRQDGIDTATALLQEQGEYALSNRMTVTKNVLSSASSGMITYICTVRYNNLEAIGKITFCRIDNGKDGADAYTPILLNTLSLDNTRTEIMLNHDISDFDYLEIYYHTISNHYESVCIRHVGKSNVSTIIHLPVYENGAMYQYQAELSISNAMASMPLSKHIKYNTANNTAESAGVSTAYISIDAIYGIK